MIDYRMSYLTGMSHSVGYSFQELSEMTGLPTETVIDQLGKIDEQLQKFSYEPIYWEKDKLYFPKQVADKWLELHFSKLEIEIFYSEYERQALLYLLTFTADEDLSVFHYQEFFQVSKNTILADIKKLRKHLAIQQISLDYSRKNGFYLSGNEEQIRIQAHQMIAKVVTSVSGKWGLKKAWSSIQERLKQTFVRIFLTRSKQVSWLLYPAELKRRFILWRMF